MSIVKYVERKGTNCNKWDGQTGMFGQENLLPFWVADMDFQVPDCVMDALNNYMKTGAFGYYKIPDSYYEAIQGWEMRHHGCNVEKDWIRFSPGVVAAFHWLVQFLTKPEDNVLVLTPVYYPFFHATGANNRNLISSELKNTDGYYEMDFEDIENKIVRNQIPLLIFCSPHNPVGRVWKREELEKLFAICKKHHVKIVSDEIHQDLTFEGHKHISALTFPEYYDLLYILKAPSKTFNLAACQNSVIIIPDENLRKLWDEYAEGVRVLNGTSFGYVAAEAAFSQGDAWYEEMLSIIHENYLYVKETFAKELPKVVVSPLEGTYLLWIDMKDYVKADELKDFMQKKCELAFDYGDWFGGEHFETHIRMNLATSKENVMEAVSRIVKNCTK